jgi:protein phosphatase
MSVARLSVDQRHERGPFDIIGDVHACLDELTDLFVTLGYQPDPVAGWRSPSSRTPVFVGDLVDRGPDNAGTLELAMRMMAAGAALAVPGNHDLQLARHLAAGDVPLVYGLEETVQALEATTAAFRADVLAFLDALPGHLVLDDGALVVAHTGLPRTRHLDEGPSARLEAAYGPDGHDMDPHDPEKRHPWVATHTGPPVIYGHTPVLDALWHHASIDIDTGCVFGWRLTALQWPERRLVSVPARRIYAKRSRPFLPYELAAAAVEG